MNPSASDYLRWISVTLAREVLPHLTDLSARACAGSAIQVLHQLSLTVAWDAAPLAERLAARQKVMQELESVALESGCELPAPPACTSTPEATDAVGLERAIAIRDAYVASLVTVVKSFAANHDNTPQANALDPWILRYCAEAASVDLRFMAPSHLGKLTRKGPPPSRTST